MKEKKYVSSARMKHTKEGKRKIRDGEKKGYIGKGLMQGKGRRKQKEE